MLLSILTLFLGVGPLNLRLYQPLKGEVDVPAAPKALRLAQFDDDLIGCGPAQRVNIYPCNAAKKFAYLSICLLVPLFVTLTKERAPESAIRPIHMFLDSSSANCQNGWILIPLQLLVC